MAKVIKKSLNISRSKKYTFDKWSDGNCYELKRGVDFFGQASSIRMSAYGAGKRLGKRFVVEIGIED